MGLVGGHGAAVYDKERGPVAGGLGVLEARRLELTLGLRGGRKGTTLPPTWSSEVVDFGLGVLGDGE
jgi:hypothetical protein